MQFYFNWGKASIQNTCLSTVNENSKCNPNTLWEVKKRHTLNETIKYSTHKKQKQRNRIKFIDAIAGL